MQTKNLEEAIIIVGDDDNESVALVCLHSAGLVGVDLSGFGFGVDDDAPYLEAPDGSLRLNLPRDAYANALLAVERDDVVVRVMDLEAGKDTDYVAHFLDKAPGAGMGAP